MENIQFQEDAFQQDYAKAHSKEVRGFAGYLIKNGIAKDIFTANIILIVLTLIVFGISIYFFNYGFNRPKFIGPVLPTSPEGLPPIPGLR